MAAANASTKSKKAATPPMQPSRSRRAVDTPVRRPQRPLAETEDIYLPGDNKVDLAQEIEGTMQSIKRTARGGTVDPNEALRKLYANEEFMNQLLLIQLSAPGTNENPIAQVIVNNRQFDIPRDRPVRVRRYVVEALAHAKQANYQTKRSALGAADHMQTRETHVWSFPFSVFDDPSGLKGREWLNKVMSDPN